MPVYRYRSFEEAERAMWTFEPDDRYYARVRQLFSVFMRLKPVKCRPGVHGFRSIEEAGSSRKMEEDFRVDW